MQGSRPFRKLFTQSPRIVRSMSKKVYKFITFFKKNLFSSKMYLILMTLLKTICPKSKKCSLKLRKKILFINFCQKFHIDKMFLWSFGRMEFWEHCRKKYSLKVRKLLAQSQKEFYNSRIFFKDIIWQIDPLDT